ncbi:MAG: hypothetical protein EHJ95_02980, partial [Methanobacteriota archaeon]
MTAMAARHPTKITRDHDPNEKSNEKDLSAEGIHYPERIAQLEAEIEALRRANADLARTNRSLQNESEKRELVDKTIETERERFNNVLETLPAYLVLLTPDFHVAFANRFFRERFGESHGRRCYEYLFGRSEPCEICETYTALKTNQPHRWEWNG